jgi:predicted 2-oxoglutarate/Fe(II)-dependent dioxygenase YbiX
MLKCETNTPEMGRLVLEAFKASPDSEIHSPLNAHYEHGQWWIMCVCGATWSVADAEGPSIRAELESNWIFDGFCFEQISDGEDGYH